MWLFLVTELRELVLSAVSAPFAMNYWVISVSESPIQRFWSGPACEVVPFQLYGVLQRAAKAGDSNKKRCAASSLGSQCWQGAQQELHPPPETELFAGGTVPPQLHLLIVQFSNRSIHYLSLLFFPSPSPPFTQNLKAQPVLYLFLGKRTAQRDSRP